MLSAKAPLSAAGVSDWDDSGGSGCGVLESGDESDGPGASATDRERQNFSARGNRAAKASNETPAQKVGRRSGMGVSEVRIRPPA